MDLLQSSKEQASGAATHLIGASSGLSNVRSVTKDSETTVAGNTKAQSSEAKEHLQAWLDADLALATGQELQQVIQSMCNNIHSLAAEFEAMDNALSKELQPKYLR